MISIILSIIAISCAIFIGIPAFILAIYAFIKINVLLNQKHEVHLVRDKESFKEDPERDAKLESIKQFNDELSADLGMIIE